LIRVTPAERECERKPIQGGEVVETHIRLTIFCLESCARDDRHDEVVVVVSMIVTNLRRKKKKKKKIQAPFCKGFCDSLDSGFSSFWGYRKELEEKAHEVYTPQLPDA
jgi:hypothetical protein